MMVVFVYSRVVVVNGFSFWLSFCMSGVFMLNSVVVSRVSRFLCRVGRLRRWLLVFGVIIRCEVFVGWLELLCGVWF